MFLLRSVFWLILAFLVMRPGVDVTGAAASISEDAMARGSQFVAAQISGIECQDIQCLGGKAIAAAALRSPQTASTPMHALPAAHAVPMPRPRPSRAG